ncbi:ChbG/HpnK family deacetylase [Pseudodesulfovibrio cashew]|uniref:ChbG/HpnK family deacetylase n=1 Tax=Pseudodesulfovibrio cashew TaxID=2678688 RepID=A0A6I6JG92_9BACT|nr:ChbG/HpnK family deacetylase [Pseudodesulfovibrio cashew]QGY39523.1 ChbG/HpnK family deacetylase [Pseudodesulfovibrio cashew]
MKVVLNAEDFGLHPAVNRAVERLLGTRNITAVSLLANGEYLEQAVKLPTPSMGVHLDILRGRPVSHWQHVATLCDENGAFLIKPDILFKRYAMGKVDHVHVEMEWSAQIERVLDLGVRPTHLTSHKHLHGWPSLTRMAATLAERYAIPWVRKPVECAEIARLDRTGFPARFQNVCRFFDREAGNVKWTTGFVNLKEMPDPVPQRVVELLEEMETVERDGLAEIRVRPGLNAVGDPPIPSYCNPPVISSQWSREYHALLQGDWPSELRLAGWEAVGFSEEYPKQP